MSKPMGVHIEYMPFSDLNRQNQALQDSVLGIVGFGEVPGAADMDKSVPINYLHAPVLAGAEDACEVFLSDITSGHFGSSPLVNGSKDAIQYRFNDDLLFGVIKVEERLVSDYAKKSDDQLSPLQQASEDAYQQIFELIDELGYTKLYRFWNYMADINASSDGLERYRQFNVGRRQAFVNAGRDEGEQLPAACALGLSTGPLSIAFLVGKATAIAVENPRQIRAYHYPDQYGPRTPSFSRGTILENAPQHYLFISGTASIVGHQTLHTNDVAGQTKETLVNMDAVIDEANRILGELKFDLNSTCFRVYVRHAQDLDAVREEMQNYLKREVRAVFIQADICRQDLLVEIEATVHSAVETMRTL